MGIYTQNGQSGLKRAGPNELRGSSGRIKKGLQNGARARPGTGRRAFGAGKLFSFIFKILLSNKIFGKKTYI
jgi:hypothetical protein